MQGGLHIAGSPLPVLSLFALLTESGNLHAVTRYRRTGASPYRVFPDWPICWWSFAVPSGVRPETAPMRKIAKGRVESVLTST